jgi:large repetitive protein
MGSLKVLNYSNSIKATYNGSNYLSPYKMTFFKCFDPNCGTCTYDQPNEAIGSKICTACASGYTYLASLDQCVSNLCGNGVFNAGEICDSGIGLQGCILNCNGSATNFTCTPPTASAASVCSCIADHGLQSGLCKPVCGNGKLQTGEACDAGNPVTFPGCLNDCSGS